MEARLADLSHGQKLVLAVFFASGWNHNQVAGAQVLVFGKVHCVEHRLDIHFNALALHTAPRHPAKNTDPVAGGPVGQPSAPGYGLHQR